MVPTWWFKDHQDSANEIDQVTDKKIDVEDQNNNTQCTSQLYRHTDRGNGAASTAREDNEKLQSGPFETDTKKKMPSKAACDCKSCMAILEQVCFSKFFSYRVTPNTKKVTTVIKRRFREGMDDNSNSELVMRSPLRNHFYVQLEHDWIYLAWVVQGFY